MSTTKDTIDSYYASKNEKNSTNPGAFDHKHRSVGSISYSNSLIKSSLESKE